MKHKYIKGDHILLKNEHIGELYVLVNDNFLQSKIRHLLGVETDNFFIDYGYLGCEEKFFFERTNIKYFFIYKLPNKKHFRMISYGNNINSFRINETFHYMSQIQYKFVIDAIVRNFFINERLKRFSNIISFPFRFINYFLFKRKLVGMIKLEDKFKFYTLKGLQKQVNTMLDEFKNKKL